MTVWQQLSPNFSPHSTSLQFFSTSKNICWGKRIEPSRNKLEDASIFLTGKIFFFSSGGIFDEVDGKTIFLFRGEFGLMGTCVAAFTVETWVSKISRGNSNGEGREPGIRQSLKTLIRISFQRWRDVSYQTFSRRCAKWRQRSTQGWSKDLSTSVFPHISSTILQTETFSCWKPLVTSWERNNSSFSR